MTGVKMQCDDCGRTVTVTQDIADDNPQCKECGGEMSEINPLETESEDELEVTCDVCERDLQIAEEFVEFEDVEYVICKRCIDKEYPRESKVEYKEKIIERIVEKPVYLNKDGTPASYADRTSRFD